MNQILNGVGKIWKAVVEFFVKIGKGIPAFFVRLSNRLKDVIANYLSEDQKDSAQKAVSFAKKNRRFFAAGAVVMVLIVALAAGSSLRNGKAETLLDIETEYEGLKHVFSVNKNDDIVALITDYYEAYASGDTETLLTLATPVSDMELSYISLMSQFITGYSDITCYVKPGVAEGEYAVSVVMSMSMEGLETAAPGLDFFYLGTDEDGNLYINNIYSQFNLYSEIEDLDEEIAAYIAEYEELDEMQELIEQVQESYEEILESDEELIELLGSTIPEAIEEWYNTYGDEDTEEE